MTFREKLTDCHHGHKHRHGHHERSTRGGRHGFHGLHELLHGLWRGHRVQGGRELSEDRSIDRRERHRGERTLNEAQSAEGQIVCSCRKVTGEQIREAILAKGLKTVEEIVDSTGAGCDCGKCITDIKLLLTGGNGRERRSGEN